MTLRHYWGGGGGGVPDPPVWDDIENLPIYEPEGEGGEGGWSIFKNEFYMRGVGGNTIAEYDWETLQQWNVYGTDNVGKITKVVNPPWREEEEEFNFYYLKDHLGSIRAVIDEENTVVSAQDFDMWGYFLENRTFDIEREKYKFTSKERDDESSYDYFGARYYVSRIGRWSSIDPSFSNYISYSPYNYCLSNPLIILDPNGMIVRWSEDFNEEYMIERIKDYESLYEQYKILHESTEIYYVSYGDLGKETGGNFNFDGERFNIVINKDVGLSLWSKLTHEFQHGVQYERGELGFFNRGYGWEPINYEITDEIDAWDATLELDYPMDRFDESGSMTELTKYSSKTTLKEKAEFLMKFNSYKDNFSDENGNYSMESLNNTNVEIQMKNWERKGELEGIKYKPYNNNN